MKIKVTLPESIAEVTLSQYQRFYKLSQRDDLNELNFNKRKIEIFTELNYNQVGQIKQTDYVDILKQIDVAINTPYGFQERFHIGSVEFGFIPNLDKITTAEFGDLSKWGVEVENLHRVMAILFRPIIKDDMLGNYEVANYKGTKEYADIMNQMPMHIVNGGLDFFFHLAKELRKHIQRSTNLAVVKDKARQTILRNGVGTPLSVN